MSCECSVVSQAGHKPFIFILRLLSGGNWSWVLSLYWHARWERRENFGSDLPQHDDSKPGVKARGRLKIKGKGKAGMVVLQECKIDEHASLFLVFLPLRVNL